MPSASQPTLIASIDGNEIFSSNGPWLYPLLELESHLPASYGRLTTVDRVVGRAGALLSVRLGVAEIHTKVLSRRAIPVLEDNGVVVQAEETVDRILCATEDLLAEVTDPDEAHRMIVARVEARRRSAPPIVAVKDLVVSRDGRRVLDHLSLELRTGETLLVRGENGAGKTTLLRALLGLLPATSGEILIEGRPVGSPEWRSRREHVAYVRQLEESTTLAISVREVVEIGARAAERSHTGRRVLEALSRVRAEHLIDRRFDALSGGERQRVSIARALAQRPSVLLLDEPTVGLDADARASLLALLDGVSQRSDVAVVLVSHDVAPEHVPHARHLVLENGALHETGTT